MLPFTLIGFHFFPGSFTLWLCYCYTNQSDPQYLLDNAPLCASTETNWLVCFST